MASATASKRAESKAPGPKHNIEAMRQAYYERIAKHDMTPLWKVMKNVVTKEPVTRCAPVVWHYDDIKRLVMESGALITAEEAERRVLILENPGMRGESKATNTLFAGVQMILPGEVAPAHRHVSSAIRFVLDGDGPVINYTYARTRPIIERMMKAGDVDKCHGARVRYANPINGGPVLPTMGANLALFPKGFKGEKYRATDGTIFVCAEGQGATTVDGKALEWGPNDVFVVPPWKHYSHRAGKESVLFSISDRPAQEALGIWREDTGTH